MKHLFTFLFVSIFLSGAFAQSIERQSFTLEQCIQYALENTVNVKNAKIDQQIAEEKVKETIGYGLPQIDGSVQVNHNSKLPRFFSKYAVAQGFSGEDALGNPNLDIPGVGPDDVIASQNFFQLPSSANAGLTLSQLIFNSSYLVGLKASSTYKELSHKSREQTEIQLIEIVTKAYYSVLVNKERISLFDNNIGRVDSLLRTTRALNENGLAEGIDVDRIQVTLNNLKSEKLKFNNLLSLSYGLLKFQMNYPLENELDVQGSLDSLKVNDHLFEEYSENWDYKNRIEYKILDTQYRLQELDVKNKYSASLPSLVGYANFGYSTQSPDIGGLFKTSTNATGAYPTGVGPDSWYQSSSFGVTLSVPIFSGLQRMHRIQQSKLTLMKIENSYASLKNGIDLEIEQNTIEFKNSIESLKSQQENMELARKVARVTKIKYEQGVGSNIEVTDAESSLREAQVNYYNNLFDAIVSKINLDRAYGKIDPSVYQQKK